MSPLFKPARLIALVVLAVVGALSGCSSGRAVRVRLLGVPAETRTLWVRGSVTTASGELIPVSEVKVENRTESVVLRLREGATGPLYIEVGATFNEDCPIALGDKMSDVESAVQEGLEVLLEPSPDSCSVNICVLGLDDPADERCQNQSSMPRGSVLGFLPDSESPDQVQLSCGTQCKLRAPRKQRIRLKAQTLGAGYFLEWSGAACNNQRTGTGIGTGDCELVAADRPQRVYARFADSVRQCSSDRICWENRAPSGATLFGIWGSETSRLWAVGEGGTILRNNGGFWYPVISGTNAKLFGVSGSADDDIWAVGAFGLILHWNGMAWEKHPEQSAGCPESFRSVHTISRTEAWAVGNRGQLCKWNGKLWSRLAVPGELTNDLVHVHGNAEEVWIVGTRGIVLRVRNGSVERVPARDGQGMDIVADLYAVWLDAESGTVYAGGADNVALRGGGGGLVAMPGPKDGITLRSLWKAPGGDLRAFGLDGGAWSFRDMRWSQEQSGVSYLSLFAAWGRSSDDLWVAGQTGNLLHWNGAYWLNTTAGVEAIRLSVHGSGRDNVWYAGAPRTIYVGNENTLLAQFTESVPWAIQAFPNRDLWVVGAADAAWYDRQKSPATVRARYAVPDERSLRAVHGLSPDDVCVVGKGGLFVRLKNGLPVVAANLGTTNLNGVLMLTPSAILVVGDQGKVYLTTGSLDPMTRELQQAQITVINTTQDLLSISASAADNIWVVGRGGVVFQYDGTGWAQLKLIATKPQQTTYTFEVKHDLNAVWTYSPRDTWFVGSDGLIVRDLGVDGPEGRLTEFMESGTSSPLVSVWGSAPDDVYFTGLGGGVLRFRPRK